jgi:hypothetical protein
MKMILIVLAVLVALNAEEASAQSYVEFQGLARQDSFSPMIDGTLIVPGKPLDTFVYFIASDTWAEAVVGIAKQVHPSFWFSVGAGVETDEDPWRVNPNVIFTKGRVFSYFGYEIGGSGYWYKSFSTYRVASKLEVGLHSQRFYGTGPLVQVSLGGGYKAWVSVAPTESRTFIGLARFF